MDITSAAIFEEIQLRREVDEHGDIRYYNKDNLVHREFGPAVIWSSGSQFWYHHGKLHRLDGPAVIYDNGRKSWQIFGYAYSERDYWKEVERLKNEI